MSDAFAERRARVLAALGTEGALVVAAAPELVVGGDSDVRYVPSADLYYLTGYTEPEAVLVLCPSADEPFTLFVRPRDPDRELWTGTRGGVDAARDVFGADATYPVAELTERLPKLIAGASHAFASLDSGRAEFDAALRRALEHARRTRPRHGRGVHTLSEPDVLLAPMRLRKDAVEIAAMRAAADITVAAFDDVARELRSAKHEYEVEAAVEYGFRRRGAAGPAFPTIAASGANATVLHYTANNAPLRAGDLVLVDAGARVQMYCADITRTYPVGGRFSPEQRAVHDIVLAAHDAVISCIAPGRTAAELDEVALRTLVTGMIELRLLEGGVDELLDKREYRRYFPHRVSHWLGLEVHDVGDYAMAGEPVKLEAGMVLTVEPGLYIPAAVASAPAGLRGIGIRLEDDVLVTAGGADVLTRALAIGAEEVEAQLGG
ncbi:MAG TPA: aminopeptidase P N-terminal domain-containing protein [Longimicrobiales bacterium]|nr:aminopeptidase P N-terminal domain-containing protein [Longimicrobiales bacterium]